MEFTVDFARLSPEEFVEQVFVDALHACAVIVGEEARFGWKNSATSTRCASWVPATSMSWSSPISATASGGPRRWPARRLAEGDVEGAGWSRWPHSVRDGRARRPSRPWARLPDREPGPDVEGLVPADGVYAGWLVRLALPDDAVDRVPCAVSIGTNPTFDGRARRVEGYVLDRTDLDLYGERVCYELVRRLRPT